MRADRVARLPAPAQSIEAEQALLGSLLIDRQVWPRIADTVTSDDFFRPDHRQIFEAVRQLQVEGNATDAVTVADLLEHQGKLVDVGGLAYLATLAKDTPTAANAETYAAAVRNRSALRRLDAVAESITRAVAAPDGRGAAELIAEARHALEQLQVRARSGRGLVEAQKLVAELIDDLDRRSEGFVGLSLGLPDFDLLSSGLEAGDLVVIAARPGMGKTALLTSIAAPLSEQQPVAVFSAEMPAMQLMRRILAQTANVSQGVLRRPKQLTDASWKDIATGTSSIARRRLWVDDTPAPALSHIRSECISLNARERLGLVLIDYVQLLRGEGANRYEQLRDVAYGLKALAKELATPIVVLAQLNRGVESREHKRPNLSDLRDSGAIEEAADIVGLLYSEAYYDPEFAMPYVLECAIAKNRNGERGECYWHFQGELSRVSQLAEGARAQYLQQRAKTRRKPPDADL